MDLSRRDVLKSLFATVAISPVTARLGYASSWSSPPPSFNGVPLPVEYQLSLGQFDVAPQIGGFKLLSWDALQRAYLSPTIYVRKNWFEYGVYRWRLEINLARDHEKKQSQSCGMIVRPELVGGTDWLQICEGTP